MERFTPETPKQLCELEYVTRACIDELANKKTKYCRFFDSSKGLFQIWWFEWGHRNVGSVTLGGVGADIQWEP